MAAGPHCGSRIARLVRKGLSEKQIL